jgi:hypothetical protein
VQRATSFHTMVSLEQLDNSILASFFAGFLLSNIIIHITGLLNSFDFFLITVVSLISIAHASTWKRNMKIVFAITTVACSITGILSATNLYFINTAMEIHSRFKIRMHHIDYKPSQTYEIWKETDDSLKQGAPILFNATQTIIASNQEKCHKGRTVYQVQEYRWGIGSELHFHANILALAIENDALFSWGKKACTKYHVNCRDLYENEHTCTDEQLDQMKKVDVTEWSTIRFPMSFIAKLPGSFTPAQLEYWWRTQAIGYLMRFNSITIEKIQLMRSKIHGDNFTLSGAININIRSGDKIRESRPSPVESYIDKAEELISRQPLSFSRLLYVTSDSEMDIHRAGIYAQKKHINIVYSNIPRMEHGNIQENVDSFWTRDITISVMMQLIMAAECDAWIGSRSSNWNRLIDIYRCAQMRKCKQIFVEAGDTMPGKYDAKPFSDI